LSSLQVVSDLGSQLPQVAMQAAQSWAMGRLLYEQGVTADDVGLIVAASDVLRTQRKFSGAPAQPALLSDAKFDNTYASKLFVLQNMLTVSSNWVVKYESLLSLSSPKPCSSYVVCVTCATVPSNSGSCQMPLQIWLICDSLHTYTFATLPCKRPSEAAAANHVQCHGPSISAEPWCLFSSVSYRYQSLMTSTTNADLHLGEILTLCMCTVHRPRCPNIRGLSADLNLQRPIS
jgi:hypothetical protein